MCFKSDAERSRLAFDKFSRHALKKRFDGAQIHSFEGSDKPNERELDLHYGIDGVFIDDTDTWHFFASRVSFGMCYSTFTVRADRPSGTATEFHKFGRVDEPNPEFTVHCYVDADGHGAVIGICETLELYQWLYRHKPKMQRNRADGVGFYAVPWRELEGVRVYYVDERGNVTDVTDKVKASAA